MTYSLSEVLSQHVLVLDTHLFTHPTFLKKSYFFTSNSAADENSA